MPKFLITLDRLHWLWLILAAPLMLFPSPKRSLALLVVPGLWIVHWAARRDRRSSVAGHRSGFPITPLNSALLLMAIMVLVSEWATYDLAFSLPKISGMVLGFGIFFAAAREGERGRGWGWCLLAFLGLGLGVAALGLLGTNWFSAKLPFMDVLTSRIPQLIRGLRGAESGFHPNEIAGALTWVLPLLMALSLGLIGVIARRRCTSGGAAISYSTGEMLLSERLLREKRPRHDTCTVEKKEVYVQGKVRGWRLVGLALLCLLATLFVSAVFIMAQSRGGYIGLAAACLGMAFLALPPRGRWIALGLLALGGIAAGVALSRIGLAPLQNWIMGSPLAEGSALSLNTLEGRVEIWSRAIYGLQDFPFTGMGMNTFREVVHVLYPLFLVAPDVDLGHAHNEFLQAGLDLGLPGLIALLALYLGAFWMLVDVWKRTHNSQLATPNSLTATFPLQQAIVLGLGGGLAAHLLYGLTDTVALGAKPGFLFWMLLGLIAGLHAQANSASVE